MPEQEQKPPSSQNVSPLWWIRVCRWLWKRIASIGGGAFIVGVALNIFSTWLTNPGGIIPTDSPTGWLLHQWPWVMLISGLLLPLTLLTWIISRLPFPSVAESSHASETVSFQQNRDRTLERLRHIYEEWLTLSLQGVAPIDLGLAEKPNALHNARTLLFRSMDQPERPLPVGTGILDVYDLAEHELLILGEPGAGKSTLLQGLATQLVVRAASDLAHPLPVLLPLASWATKCLPLHDWMVEQLTHIYGIAPQMSQQWMEADLLLPLLDGLDEVDPAARLACITAINAFHFERFAVPLVVCSRTTDYERAAAKRRLVLQRAVVVQPLTAGQIDTALAAGGKPLAALRSAFKKNRTLQELATTPLMVSILLMTYQGVTIRTLSAQGSQVQQQIWEDYVQRMMRSKGDVMRYPPEVTKKWLRWLAREMRQRNLATFSLVQLQPDWLPGRYRWFYWWVYRLGGAFLLGLVSLLFFWMVVHLTLGLSCLIGASAGVLFGGLSGQSAQKELAIHRPVSNLRQTMIGGVAWGVASALILAIAGKPNDLLLLLLLLSIGLFVGVFIGVLFWLIGKFSGKWQIEEHSEFLSRFSRGFNAGAQYVLLRFWLWRIHVFPWKAKAFLDDGVIRILLRRVESEYSFTHRLLLDYFADLALDSSDTSPKEPQIESEK